MKKIVYLALCFGALASLDSCNPKAKATPGQVAKRYTERIMNDDYDAFVRAIRFTETPADAAPKAKAYSRSMAKAATNDAQHEMRESRRDWNHQAAREMRTVNHPSVTERGGIRQVEVVSEVVTPDESVDVIIENTYADGLVEQVEYKMINDDQDWKIRVTDNKEVWRATTDRHDRETLKIRDNRKRDFLKDNERGDRRFVKELTKRDGQREVVKTLGDGRRHRDVVKVLEEGNRQIEKVKIDGHKLVDLKEVERGHDEIIKAKENFRGEHDRFREVVR